MSLPELCDQNAHVLCLQFGHGHLFDLIGLSMGGLLVHLTALAARRCGANSRFLILIDPNTPAPSPGIPPQTMAELGYYAFWHLVHQARLEFLEEESPAKVAVSMAHLSEDEIPAFVVDRYMAVAKTGARSIVRTGDQQLVIELTRQIRVKQHMNHLLCARLFSCRRPNSWANQPVASDPCAFRDRALRTDAFGVQQIAKLPRYTPRSGQPGVVIYMGLSRREWFGAGDVDASDGSQRLLRDYGQTAAVLVCGDRGHVDQCGIAASDRLPLWSSLLVELLVGALELSICDSEDAALRDDESHEMEQDDPGEVAPVTPPQVVVQLLSGELRAMDTTFRQTLGMATRCLFGELHGQLRLVPPCARTRVTSGDEVLLCELIPPGITKARIEKPLLAHLYEVTRETAHVLLAGEGAADGQWRECSVDVAFMFLQVADESIAFANRCAAWAGISVLLTDTANVTSVGDVEARFIAQANTRADVLALKMCAGQDERGRRICQLMGWPNRADEPFEPVLLAFKTTGHQVGGLGGAAVLASPSTLHRWYRDVWKA